MTDRSVPIEIGGEKYHLRFERNDGRDIERNHAPILVLLQPGRFGWDTTAIFLHKGLKRETEKGELVFALPQTAEGEDKAFELAQTFTNQFKGAALGLSLIYALINQALIVSGWYMAPDETPPKTETKVVDPSKNLVTP